MPGSPYCLPWLSTQKQSSLQSLSSIEHHIRMEVFKLQGTGTDYISNVCHWGDWWAWLMFASNIARLKIWHVEHIFSIKRIRLLLDVISVQYSNSKNRWISIFQYFFYQGNDSIIWGSAVVTTVSPGHVNSCMNLVSGIHLKVWMPIDCPDLRLVTGCVGGE